MVLGSVGQSLEGRGIGINNLRRGQVLYILDTFVNNSHHVEKYNNKLFSVLHT